jgi:hypothetical protein
MRIYTVSLVFLALSGVAVFGASAQDAPPADEIIAKANHMAYYQGEDGRSRVAMTITDSQGRTREKEFTILRKNMDDEDRAQRFYVYFHRPADERETVFMVHKHVGKDDDRWLYLPALDVVKRIAASDERTSFVGSDFYYEDVSGRGVDEDDHELVQTTDTAYVVRSTPKDPSLVEFDSYTIYIHKTTFIPFRVEYLKGERKYRELEVLQVEEIQGFRTITKQKMSDLDSGSSTLIENTKVEYGLGLPDDIFTERFLRRAPREHLR